MCQSTATMPIKRCVRRAFQDPVQNCENVLTVDLLVDDWIIEVDHSDKETMGRTRRGRRVYFVEECSFEPLPVHVRYMHVVMAVAVYTIILMKGRSKTQQARAILDTVHDVQAHTHAGPGHADNWAARHSPPRDSPGGCKPDIGTETHTRTRTHTLYVEIIIPHFIVNLLVLIVMAYVHTRI